MVLVVAITKKAPKVIIDPWTKHNVRDELIKKAFKNAEEFLNDSDLSEYVEIGDVKNFTFNITTRKKNHICLRVSCLANKVFKSEIVSIPLDKVDYEVS